MIRVEQEAKRVVVKQSGRVEKNSSIVWKSHLNGTSG